MKRSPSILLFFLGMILLAVVALVLVALSGGSPDTMSASQCQTNAEARNLAWQYDAVGGCRVLTPSGAWIPISQYKYPVGSP